MGGRGDPLATTLTCVRIAISLTLHSNRPCDPVTRGTLVTQHSVRKKHLPKGSRGRKPVARRRGPLFAAGGGWGVLCRHTCRRLRLQAPPGSARNRRRPRAAAGPLERCTEWNRAGPAAASSLFGAGAEQVLNTELSPHLEPHHFPVLSKLTHLFADTAARSPLASQSASCTRSILRGWILSAAPQPMLPQRLHGLVCV